MVCDSRLGPVKTMIKLQSNPGVSILNIRSCRINALGRTSLATSAIRVRQTGPTYANVINISCTENGTLLGTIGIDRLCHVCLACACLCQFVSGVSAEICSILTDWRGLQFVLCILSVQVQTAAACSTQKTGVTQL